MEDKVTLRRILITSLINQVVGLNSQSVSKQIQSSIAFKNTVEAIISLKQSDICVITEEEIDEAIIKMQLNSLLESTTHG